MKSTKQVLEEGKKLPPEQEAELHALLLLAPLLVALKKERK